MNLKAIAVCAVLVNSAQAAEVLTVCGDADYPPFTYAKRLKNGDKPAVGAPIEGVGPDVLRLIFAPLGITVESTYQGNWKRCQANVEDGSTDIMMGAYKNDDREKYAIYTKSPLAPDPQSIFVWKGKEFPFEKWDDLLGKKTGIPLGFSAGEKFDDFLNRNKLAGSSPDRKSNYMKLEAGRIDFDVNGLYAGLVSAKELGYGSTIVPLKNPINVEYVFVPISKKSKYANKVQIIEEGLKKLTADGTIAKLVQKHMAEFGVQMPNTK